MIKFDFFPVMNVIFYFIIHSVIPVEKNPTVLLQLFKMAQIFENLQQWK